MSDNESILEEAQRIIFGARNASYGHPRDNFQNIADLWNGYLAKYHTEISQMDVANLVILLKVARLNGTGYHRDSVVDIAGYAGTIERLQEPETVEWENNVVSVRLEAATLPFRAEAAAADLAGFAAELEQLGVVEPTDADVEDDDDTVTWPPNEYLEGPPRQWMYLRDDIPEDVVAVVNKEGRVYKRDHEGEWRTVEGLTGRSTHWVSWFTEVRSWDSIHAVPAGTSVTDCDGDVFTKDPDGVLLFGGRPWGEIRMLFDIELGPFTEILGD